MNLKQSVLFGLLITVTALIAWEIYWRNQGFTATLDDNEALWAVQRAKVEKAGKKNGGHVMLEST